MSYETEMPFVVANIKDFEGAIWGAYDSEGAAMKGIALAQTYKSDRDLTITTWSVIEVLQDKYEADLINGSLKEIDEERYNEMLEVLPPMNWDTHFGLSSFFMCEFWSGSITDQYAICDGKYYSKRVDYRKRDTWITRKDILAL